MFLIEKITKFSLDPILNTQSFNKGLLGISVSGPFEQPREYRFTHMNRSTVDILFLSGALSGERI